MKNNEMKRAVYKSNIFYKISKFLNEKFNNGPVEENVFTAYFNGVSEK